MSVTDQITPATDAEVAEWKASPGWQPYSGRDVHRLIARLEAAEAERDEARRVASRSSRRTRLATTRD